MVAFATPTLRVHHFRPVDDPTDAGPDTRPEAERLADLIASFERHLQGMSGLAKENFQEAVDAMKARLAELRQQEHGPAAVAAATASDNPESTS